MPSAPRRAPASIDGSRLPGCRPQTAWPAARRAGRAQTAAPWVSAVELAWRQDHRPVHRARRPQPIAGRHGKGALLALVREGADARRRSARQYPRRRTVGLIIVSVVNFLIGAILAFVGAVQLRKFAADIFVANLVGLAVVREMAAVMTAIVMAGRTGGAYAARIATMQGNEELDALEVVGIPVSDYILLPSVLALVFTMPLLYLYGCLVGMLGGFVVSISMLNVTAAGLSCTRRSARSVRPVRLRLRQVDRLCHPDRVTSCRIGLRPDAALPMSAPPRPGPLWSASSASSPWTRSSPSLPMWSGSD